jgi:hypothetical protein
MPIVSTGQITIVDTNDARTITAALVASSGTQQVYTKDESTLSYTPSWITSPLTLTPQISVGGLTSALAWGALTNKTFALTAGGTALTTASTSTSFVNNADVAVSTPFTVTHAANGSATASTFVLTGNLKDTVATFTLFFDADFTDPATLLVTHITCQITLNSMKTGTNAVFITIRGQTNIEEATGATKNNIAVAADLVRSGGVDTTGLTYKWYEAGGSTQITTSLPSVATEYGLKTTTAGTVPTGAPGELNVNIPTAAGNAFNTLVINESAVADIGIYKVEITDADAKTYTQYFTIYDISDPYDVNVLSSTGDKLQNGQGSTTLTPEVYYGATKVTPLTGWSFSYYLYDKNGKRAGFVDTSKVSVAGGAPITSHTTGASATFTFSGAAVIFPLDSLIKCVKPNGDAFYYEVVGNGTTAVNTVAIKTPTVTTWLNFTDFPSPSASTDFVGGKLYGCTGGSGATAGTLATNGLRTVSVTPWQITVTGDEIDVKGRILVEANRP